MALGVTWLILTKLTRSFCGRFRSYRAPAGLPARKCNPGGAGQKWSMIPNVCDKT